jgi:hypothetical protein
MSTTKQKISIPGGKSNNKLIKITKDDTYTKRMQYLQNRKAQSISGQVETANGQIGSLGSLVGNLIPDKPRKPKDKLQDTLASGFSRNESLKCLNDGVTIFKLKSELLEYKTKTEKLQMEITVRGYI